jgi:hypothetical protein
LDSYPTLAEEELSSAWENYVSSRLHKGQFRNFCYSPDIILVVKSRGMRWAGHVARMREIKMPTEFSRKIL